MSLDAIATKGAEGPSRANTVKFNVTALLMKWRMKYRGHKELTALSDFMLKDIGISRSQVEQEYTKPFWKN
ncbi:DUF1127 domain-containing protein [Marinobacter sp. SS13-12]|uniref:DUF1127 domain-containing protein n=1 Tax=Marinobacter sp. SS13-12 TaxID=3050451 RepID=UPI002557BE3E|nr:DUF1127 domain-containing protein [Marinobacter sp. SS13-12]MDK8465464.1 DUF1127 domain-containing protein [Marinobacter sp. SS13-12]